MTALEKLVRKERNSRSKGLKKLRKSRDMVTKMTGKKILLSYVARNFFLSNDFDIAQKAKTIMYFTSKETIYQFLKSK
jgi:hypothetical protein